MLEPGELVGGKYRVEELLGAGGMGVVHAATHIHLGTRVAIKFMAEHSARVEATGRLLREARVVARMSSSHVARVLDMGILLDDSPFVVMELLEGEDLASMLARRGPLPIREALGYLVQACEAIGEAHELGIIHRDIKPSNLFVTHDACVKVLDFGVAKMSAAYPHERPDFSFTRSDSVIGSPLYMAPEQAVSPKTVDSRADIWGLGMTLWQLLTGAPVFQAENLASLVLKTATAELPDLQALRRDVSLELRTLIGECLEKAPERRLQSADLLAERLSSLLASQAEPSRISSSRQKDELRPVAVSTLRQGSERKSGGLRVGHWLLVSAVAVALSFLLHRELLSGSARRPAEPRQASAGPVAVSASAQGPSSEPSASPPSEPTLLKAALDTEKRATEEALRRPSRNARPRPAQSPPDASPPRELVADAPSAPTHRLPGLFDRK